MNRIIKEIKEVLSRRDLIPKIVSLLLAVFLWAYIGSTKIGEIKFKVPIETRNLSKSLVVSYMQRNSITVTLNGNKDDIKNVNVKNLRVFVNLENPVLGENVRYPIEVVKQQIPENIDYSLSSNRVSMTVEKKFYKKVKVIPLISGKLKKGYVMGNIKVNPEFIVLSGPKSIIQDIESIKTKGFSIEDEMTNIVREVPIDRENIKNVDVSHVNVSLTIPVFDSSNLFRFDKVVELRNADESFSYKFLSSNSIILFVKATREEVQFSEDDFEVFVDIASKNLKKTFSKVKENSIVEGFTIKVSPRSRENIKFVYTIPEMVSIRIVKK
jgi:hypothetical protein